MKEFMGLAMLPLRFAASFMRSESGRLTQASISRTGTSISFVSSLRGASIFGALVEVDFGRGALTRGDFATLAPVFERRIWGDPSRPTARPLLVRLKESLEGVEGVKGEEDSSLVLKSDGKFCERSVLSRCSDVPATYRNTILNKRVTSILLVTDVTDS